MKGLVFGLVLWTGIFNLAAQTVYKVRTEVSPHYIRANQPFSLIFSFKFPMSYGNLNDEGMKAMLMPDTTDFILLGKPNSIFLPDFKNGTSSNKYKFAYTLVPRHSGNLEIQWQAFQYNYLAGFRYDSVLIHVYDDRISPEDSLEKKRAADNILRDTNAVANKSFANTATTSVTYSGNANQLMNQFFAHPQCPDGIHFDYMDTVYRVAKEQIFQVIYSLSFVNVPGANSSTTSQVTPGEIACPKNIEIKSNSKYNVNTMTVNGKVINQFTLKDTFKVIAHKKGIYRILPMPFTYNGQNFMSPRIKIVVDDE